MSNPNFYNFCSNNDATFQSLPSDCVPPPPAPPAYFIPLSTVVAKQEQADKEAVKKIEQKLPVQKPKKVKLKLLTIADVRNTVSLLVHTLNDLKCKQNILLEKQTQLSEEEWNAHVAKIEEIKQHIEDILSQIDGPRLDTMQKILSRRTSKRLRLKKRSLEKKRDDEKKTKELEERSRKIDENLQKIQDDIKRAKQEEEAKRQADIVLKEVVRKKTDAKRCLKKMDALVKLRKAKQNTAKGRGENVPENDGAAFNLHIEKLKLLWTEKLELYTKEEADLQASLKKDNTLDKSEAEKQVASNLDQWCETLFGGTKPQADLNGDRDQFVDIRAQWDKTISSEGSPLPVGWVPPAPKSDQCVTDDTQ